MQSIIDSGSSAFAFLSYGLFCVETGISVPCFLQQGNDTLPVTIITGISVKCFLQQGNDTLPVTITIGFRFRVFSSTVTTRYR